MGMLDEAIREHLELKRRRGADPTEVAREEREALDPAFAAPQPEPGAASEAGEDVAPLAQEDGVPVEDAPAQSTHGPHGDELAEAFEPAPAPDIAPGLGVETAEIDMRAVLDEDAPPGTAEPAATAPAEPVRVAGFAAPEPASDAADWESPERGSEPPPQPLPGQERMSFE